MNLNAVNDIAVQPPRAFPEIILPDSASVFLNRAERFESLARGHALADWLTFQSRIAASQHRLLADYPPLALPDDDCLDFARQRGLPPIPASSWPRDSFWRHTLSQIIDEILPHAPAPAQATLARLRALDQATVETLADHILRLSFQCEHPEYTPFIAAALQIYWTALAAKLDPAKITPPAPSGTCPSCGFLPVAGVVRTDGDIPNLRYLQCGLCNTQWYLVRVTCAACRDQSAIAYRYIEQGDAAVRAETCDSCGSYLKIIYREKSPRADAVADDLASVALDLLVEEAGYNRMSPNLLFTQSA